MTFHHSYQHFKRPHKRPQNHTRNSTANSSSQPPSAFEQYFKWPLIGMASFLCLGVLIYIIYRLIVSNKRSNVSSVSQAGVQPLPYQQAQDDYSGLKPEGNPFEKKKKMLQSVTWKLDTAGKGRK